MNRSRPRVLLLTMQSASWREFEAIKSLRTMFVDDHRLDVVVADARLPLAPGMSSLKPDMIVLTSSFLGARYSFGLLEKVRRKFDFIAREQALKVAMPQDDYDCSRVLDTWLSEWSIDIIYTVCPTNWSFLYPLSREKSEVRLGYTSYITDSQIVALETLKSWNQRNIDVSYRATSLPLNFGSLGVMKASVGDYFQRSISNPSKFHLDINVGSRSAITGSRWLEFIESSRFVLVSPSGSSFVDPIGDLRQLALEPEFEAATVPDFLAEASRRGLEWYELPISAISPRNIEAALRGTVQIAIPGEYSGILRAEDHYVALDESFDADTVLGDEADWLRVRSAARDAVLSVRRLRANELVSELLGSLSQLATTSESIGREKDLRRSIRWRLIVGSSRVVNPAIRKLAAIALIVMRKIQDMADRSPKEETRVELLDS